jgi:hypothetical protein
MPKKTQKYAGYAFKDKRDVFSRVGQYLNSLHPRRGECLPEFRMPVLNPLSNSCSRVLAYPGNTLSGKIFFIRFDGQFN